MRELGPVLTALMVTGRVDLPLPLKLEQCVTEQIDALYAMAVHPVQYLVVPRMLAAVIMLPILTAFCDLVGIGGAYLVSVGMMGVDGGMFLDKIQIYASSWDVTSV